jgi:hypothetical protein
MPAASAASSGSIAAVTRRRCEMLALIDFVVTDLAQVRVALAPPFEWSLVFQGFDPAQEGIREALCTLGNGYFATRGAAAGAVADDIHYPGTYFAGGYDRLRTDIAGLVLENEDLVNFPNWLALEFRIAEQDWFDARTVELLSYRQDLEPLAGKVVGEDSVYLLVRTCQSNIHVAQVARTRAFLDGASRDPPPGHRRTRIYRAGTQS